MRLEPLRGPSGGQLDRLRGDPTRNWWDTGLVVETIPILPSADFDVTVSFWASLGFRSRGRWDDYLVLRHEDLGIELHFWHDTGVDRWTNDVACYIRFPTPEAARDRHAQWRDLDIPEPAVLSMPKDEPGGATEFHVIDLHGNLVRLGGFPAPD